MRSEKQTPEKSSDSKPATLVSMMMDSLLPVFFVAALCVLTFLAGAAVMYYRWHFSNNMEDAFEAGQAFFDKEIQGIDATLPPPERAEAALANKRVAVWDKEHAFNGYTLITVLGSPDAYLLNMEGEIVYRWKVPLRESWPKGQDTQGFSGRYRIYMSKAYAFPNGDLLTIFHGAGTTPYGHGMLKMDKNGKILWNFDDRTHHDFYIDKENGNIYTFTHYFNRKALPGLERLTFPIFSDSVVILSPDGQKIKEIPLLQAFQGTPYEPMLYHEGDLKRDIFHSNSIMKLEPEIAHKFPMFKAGYILISIRNMSALAVIDPDSGKVVHMYYGPWEVQHSAHFLPNGHILLFDNTGTYIDRVRYSRVLEFDPNTLRIMWHYTGNDDQPFYSSGRSRVQRLLNGNTLIISSFDLRVFEVTPEGKVVWDYILPGIKTLRPEEDQPLIESALRYSAEDLPFLLSAGQ